MSIKELKELISGARLLATAAAIVVLLVGIWLYRTISQSQIEIGAEDGIGNTPTQIESIRAIGEWEFLAVSDEQLVDTTRKGLLKDDHLVRIYYGTLRLGVDMKEAAPHWLTVSGDTVTAVMPKVKLLDRDFIDEARTQSFFESGTWKAADREALYRRAYQRMKARCVTRQNLQTAQTNGEAQLTNMLRAMGYRHIIIRFEE